MAKKRLKIKDKQGNLVNYDISAASVTIDVEGKSLDVKLTELVAALANRIQSVTYNGNPQSMDGNGNININQAQADWGQVVETYPSFIRNKPNLARVATTGSYNDLSDKPQSVDVECDTEMSGTSEKAVQNKVIKAYVDNRISGLIDGAPQALDTLNELAAALGDNSNFASAITQQLATKQDALVAGNGITIANDGKTVSVAEAIRTGAAAGATALQPSDVSVEIPATPDGTVDIHVDDDTYTIDLNHEHPDYQPKLTSANAGSNITITTDPQTGEVIISAAGGGGGSVTIDPSITGANQANPVAGGAIYTALQGKANASEMSITAVSGDSTKMTIQLKSGASQNVVTEHQSLAGRVQSQDVVNIVKITQSAYDALQAKDSSTLYLITES